MCKFTKFLHQLMWMPQTQFVNSFLIKLVLPGTGVCKSLFAWYLLNLGRVNKVLIQYLLMYYIKKSFNIIFIENKKVIKISYFSFSYKRFLKIFSKLMRLGIQKISVYYTFMCIHKCVNLLKL